MDVAARVRELSEPIAAELGLVLFDVEDAGGVLRVTVDRDGGVDLEAIAEATRRLSRALDTHDPVPGRYTLEVSSPGLERTLRTPAHFRWALGRKVAVKLHPGVEGPRRLTGSVVEVDGEGVDLRLDDAAGAVRRLRLDDIQRARTVFEWGPAPKPGRGRAGSHRSHTSEVETS